MSFASGRVAVRVGVAVLLALPACVDTKVQGGVTLRIACDPALCETPEPPDTLTIEVRVARGNDPAPRTWAYPRDVTFPTSLAVVAGAGGGEDVVVVATMAHAGAPIGSGQWAGTVSSSEITGGSMWLRPSRVEPYGGPPVVEADAGSDAASEAGPDATSCPATRCPPDAPVCLGGTCTQPLSCRDANLQPNGPSLRCGPPAESCCSSPIVPGGAFARTYTNGGNGASGDAAPAVVSDFRLDKYLVTVGRFRHFLQVAATASAWRPRASSGKHEHLNGGRGLANVAAPGTFEPGWSAAEDAEVDPSDVNLACDPRFATWTSAPGANENLPINCVNWWEAYAFCIWDGGFLPSEAEWVFAAAGGDEQREYPWGSTNPGTTSDYAIYNCYYGGGTCSTIASVAPVGTAPLGGGKWGQMDLAGDAKEWLLDWSAPYVSLSVDAANLSPGTERTLHGGSFENSTGTLLPQQRNRFPPINRDVGLGFRCARSP